MKSTFLYLVRHGAIINVNGKRYIGQIEAPLSERGVEQAWALRNWLEPVDFSRAFCSDITRSQRTAKIVIGQRDIPLQVSAELREISLGDWEGVSFHDIASRFPKEYEARGKDLENWRPPGGESFGDCRKRVLPFLRRMLADSQGNVLLVGHAGINRLILCEALGIPVKNLMNIGQDYGCVNLIEYSDSRVRLHLQNYAPLGTRPVAQASSIADARKAAH
jgi:probable phosphoglycerate mutase